MIHIYIYNILILYDGIGQKCSPSAKGSSYTDVWDKLWVQLYPIVSASPHSPDLHNNPSPVILDIW